LSQTGYGICGSTQPNTFTNEGQARLRNTNNKMHNAIQPLLSRDRETGYTKTGYMEEATTMFFEKSNVAKIVVGEILEISAS
jgi:hypothetical protein